MMGTLATPYVFWILLCSSSLWKRAGANYRSIFRRSGADRTGDILYMKKPSVLDKISIHLFIIAVGISCTLVCAFLFLFIAYIIDTISRRDLRARSERGVKRSRIPKIVLERAQTGKSHFDDDNNEDEEEEDETDTDSTRKMQPFKLSRNDYEGERSAFDRRISIARSTQSDKASLPITASPSHLPISGYELTNENPSRETKEEYLKWLKSIHMILQITYAVQPHLQGRRNEERINTRDISVNPCHERG